MSKNSKIGGVIAVLVTPYHADGSVDTEGMETLCRRVANAGCNGAFVAGSTGDMALLGHRDRCAILRAARKGLGDNAQLFAGVTDFYFDGIEENTRVFADLGVDVGVLMPPLMFFKYSANEMTEWFRRAADSSPLPILLYHHMRVSTPIPLETILAVAKHPNIIGMKETSQTIDRTYEILDTIRNEDFVFLQGREAFALDSLLHGADGLLAALGCIVPEYYATLWEAFQKKDMHRVQEINAKLDRLAGIFDLMPTDKSFSYFGYALKKALMYRGWTDNATSRIPGFEPDPAFDEVLFEFLKSIDFPTA
ncbi:MAG: dihydrodipicolinate synthase family protein [Planctomycetia bacterium]|nr:dihydrodipicolinate synthase family protein [Planctomycetia bacterium]